MLLESLEDLLTQAIVNVSNRLFYCKISALSKSECEDILRCSSLDLDGYTHIIDAYAVVHILNRHGNSMKESAKQQVAVTMADIAHIPSVITGYDDLRYEFLKNRHSLIYQKTIGERTFVYVAEIRIGRKRQVCAQTLWIQQMKKAT